MTTNHVSVILNDGYQVHFSFLTGFLNESDIASTTIEDAGISGYLYKVIFDDGTYLRIALGSKNSTPLVGDPTFDNLEHYHFATNGEGFRILDNIGVDDPGSVAIEMRESDEDILAAFSPNAAWDGWVGNLFDPDFPALWLQDNNNIHPTDGGTVTVNQVLTGYAGDNLVMGGAGNDTIYYSGFQSTLSGGPSIANGVSGNDTFIFEANVIQPNDFVTVYGDHPNDFFVTPTGTEINTIEARGNNDFSLIDMFWIDRVVYNGATQLTFAGGAFSGTNHIAPDAEIAGDGNSNGFIVYMEPSNISPGHTNFGATGLLDLSQLAFTGWSAGTDTVVIYGKQETGGAGGTIIGPNVATTFIGGLAAEQMTGGTANDTIQGFGNVDILDGGGGNDLVDGGDDNDDLDGGEGDDTLAGGAGDDVIDGEGGNDVASYAAASGGVTVSLAISGFQAVGGGEGFDSLISIENLLGSGHGDVLTGTANANSLAGGAGSDTLIGGAGDDTLDGGGDTDTADYSAAAGAVTVNLSLAGPQFVSVSQGSDTLVSIENIVGSGLGDTLTGNGNANRIDAGNGGDTVAGLDGDDLLIGGTGPDLVDGGAGNDTIAGGIGNDTLIGGAGNDTADYSGLNGAVTVNLSTATGQLTGLGTDTISLFENILGGIGNDKFTGTTGGNRMEGAGGSDQLNGLGGADTLLGGAGNDNLQGGNGNDTIIGGAGRDIMVGGGDSDTFVFNAAAESAVGGQRDRINDFSQGTDKVDLSAIDAMTGGADDDFAFIGTGGFSGSGTQGELRFFQLAGPGQTVVEGDIDGNGAADFQIAFIGLFNFNAGDFLGVT